MRLGVLSALLLVACGGGGRDAPDGGDDTPTGDGPTTNPDAPPVTEDRDADGLDDAYEMILAVTYRPFLSVHSDDGCALSGIAVRVWPHPADATKIAIIYDHLFETDCGLGGHVGDNEVFGMAVDPAIPPPQGILGIRTASHQATICERITDCGPCTDNACDTAMVGGVSMPVVYSSKDKHGTYARLSQCGLGTCFDTCELAPTAHDPPMINVGEPGATLVTNLTQGGLITSANGWTEAELMDFDPWGTVDFGGAGNVAEDFVDPTFLVGLCN